MDNSYAANSFIGAIFAFISIFFGMFASILTDLEILVRVFAGCIAALSGILAGRYYYYAIIEKKLSILEKKEAIKKQKVNDEQHP